MTACAHPKSSDVQAVKELVFRCFPEDSGEFLSAVFENVFTPEETLILRTDGVVSAAVMLPRFRLSDGRDFGYVYCLCTSPDFRGKGLMRRLLTEAEKFCAARNDSFVALVPADEKLAVSYSKMGYDPLTFSRAEGFPSDIHFERRATEKDIPLLCRLYGDEFASALHIARSPKLWKTLIDLYSADGGGIFIHNGGYLFAESHGNGFIIRETAGTDAPANAGVRLPAFSGAPRVFAKGYSGDPPLLNLLFD